MPRFLPRMGVLGNAGAVANARRALDEERRRAWVVDALVSRLPPPSPEAPTVPISLAGAHPASAPEAPAA